jgi:hypothetical protein
MPNINHFRSLLITSAMALLAGAIAFLIIDRSSPPPTADGVTTARAAAAAGAQVEPTEPKLRVEPK